MLHSRQFGLQWATAMIVAAMLCATAPASAAIMTETNPVCYVFDVQGSFNLERIAINFNVPSSSVRFDAHESIRYGIGSSPFSDNFGSGYHHQDESGSYGYNASIRNEADSARVEFLVPGGKLYVTANYVNGDVAINSMRINDNAGTTYYGTLVPEPGTGLLLLGAAVAGVARRRRSH